MLVTGAGPPAQSRAVSTVGRPANDKLADRLPGVARYRTLSVTRGEAPPTDKWGGIRHLDDRQRGGPLPRVLPDRVGHLTGRVQVGQHDIGAVRRVVVPAVQERGELLVTGSAP